MSDLTAWGRAYRVREDAYIDDWGMDGPARRAYAAFVNRSTAPNDSALAQVNDGRRVEIRSDSVTLISLKDGAMPDPFPTIEAAYQWFLKRKYG